MRYGANEIKPHDNRPFDGSKEQASSTLAARGPSQVAHEINDLHQHLAIMEESLEELRVRLEGVMVPRPMPVREVAPKPDHPEDSICVVAGQIKAANDRIIKLVSTTHSILRELEV